MSRKPPVVQADSCIQDQQPRETIIELNSELKGPVGTRSKVARPALGPEPYCASQDRARASIWQLEEPEGARGSCTQ